MRVLAEGEIDRVGGTRPIPIDVRVIAATHRDLEASIENEKFREDLYYRLNVIPIHLPPLRERQEDIPHLVNHYLKVFNESKGKNVTGVDPQALKILCNYPWPGNIRELANFVERMVVLSRSGTLTPRDLPAKVLGDTPQENWAPHEEEVPGDSPRNFTEQSAATLLSGLPEEGISLKQVVEEFEKELIVEALDRTDWVKNKAAQVLGLNRTTTGKKLKNENHPSVNHWANLRVIR